MRLTVIPSDGAVYKDGICYADLTWEGTPVEVHALQWFNTQGWIEFKDSDPYDNYKPPNEIIRELPQWVLNAIAAWEIANKPILNPTIEETPLN